MIIHSIAALCLAVFMIVLGASFLKKGWNHPSNQRDNLKGLGLSLQVAAFGFFFAGIEDFQVPLGTSLFLFSILVAAAFRLRLSEDNGNRLAIASILLFSAWLVSWNGRLSAEESILLVGLFVWIFTRRPFLKGFSDLVKHWFRWSGSPGFGSGSEVHFPR